jgi:acyl dehydratase
MSGGISYAQRYFEDVAVGDSLPETEDYVSFERVIMTPGTTWDYFPGHHDAEYARAQGQPTIYVNTMHVMGFIDRLVTDWAGPATFLARRWIRLHQPIYAGDTVLGGGEITACRSEERQGRLRHLVDFQLSVVNQHGSRCASAHVVAELPLRQIDARSPNAVG